MKYRIFILGLIAILFAACAVSEVDHSAPLLDDGEEFYATIEGATTKAYVDEDLRVLWHADDRVSIFYEYTFNRQYRFTGETGDNSGTFEKVSQDDFITGNALDYVYAVYPYKEGTKISNRGVLTLDLPATQTYAENSFGIGANTMVSCSEGNELLFKNLCGYIMLKLYGDDVSVSSISLKGNNNEPLAGKATVTASVDGNPSLSFDETAAHEITLTFDIPVTLGTTAETATDFWLVVPPMTISGGITLTVTDDRNGIFEKSTTKSLEIRRNTLSRMSSLEVVMPGSAVPEAVDLGVPSGVKWASFNLGASSPEEYGDYYAWGEIEPYYSSLDPLSWKEGKEAGYAWASYKWSDGSDTSLTKYNTLSSYGNTVDNKTVLDPENDAAHAALGGKWRMPTDAEWAELLYYTTWEWTDDYNGSGVAGWIFTSNVEGYKDKRIFLPAAGIGYNTHISSIGSYGYYLSSSLRPDYPYRAWFVYFSSNDVYRSNYIRRYGGQSVRPVYCEDPAAGVIGIALDRSSASLFVGEILGIQAMFNAGAINRDVQWSSSNTAVATVDYAGNVTAVSVGSATITARTVFGGFTATCTITVQELGEWVDLGLSVKWASFNLGASSPEEYGDYYAWGETEPKDVYNWSTYRWCNGSETSLTKYNTNSSYGIVDNKTELDPEDDAAHVALGGKWRMPTDAEWTELRENCTWEWTDNYYGTGVAGWIVTSNVEGYKDKRIFLPAAGERLDSDFSGAGFYCDYRSSSLCTEFPYVAWNIFFNSDYVYRHNYYRYYGHSVRPVYAE